MNQKQSYIVLSGDESQLVCPECSCLMRYKYGGIFVCDTCGTESTNDYGKVKKYLEEHGPTNAFDLSQGTGVSSSKISSYLREGKLEIPENSEIFLHCKGCGTPIRFGEYCVRCAKSLDLKGSYVGDIPKNRGGKLRFRKD
ncbi:MAG: hypothetical protein ACI4SQ_06215 [Eubacterium sp.]